MTERVLQFTAPHTVSHATVPARDPGPRQVRVETELSGISPGTELLVYRDQIPSDFPVDETLTAFDGTFSYPIEYGYSAVGTVTETGQAVEDAWLGRRVFGFQPHRSAFLAEPADLIVLPERITAATGAMLPTVETAITLVLDCQPRLGERVVVFGAGVVGLSTIRLLSSFPLSELVVVEPLQERRTRALAFGADRAVTPDEAREALDEMDLAVELSGQPEALDDAITVVGFDSRIVVGSWYGTKQASLDLGGRFHRDRISITASQVSSIAPALSGRWDRERRSKTVLEWLERFEAEQLITHRIAFEDAHRAYELLDESREETLQVLLTYE